mmetsp:Transcript_75460/g.209622  ORF Transcript_75460/g.209622 Transcript_75460/m.209622 type:complete len:237 (-) Transcript_75460:97-807(-)
MMSMLQCITGGVDWNDVERPLEEISWLYRLIFASYILFVMIGVMNVLTGIFVERATQLRGIDRDLVIRAEQARNEAFWVEMKGLFEEADTDGSGTINYQEFVDYLKNKDVRAYLASQQLDSFDARQLFNILDVKEDQEIGVEEFILGCTRLKGLAKSVDVVALLQETRNLSQKLKKYMAEVQEQLDCIAAGRNTSRAARRHSCIVTMRSNSRKPSTSSAASGIAASHLRRGGIKLA